MAAVAALAERFLTQERSAGNLLDADTVTAQAVAATRFYAGFAELDTPATEIEAATELTDSEWALIRPLFLLYVEREQALHVEASAMLGVSGFGRGTSEIAGEILQVEADMPRRAFFQPIFTV